MSNEQDQNIRWSVITVAYNSANVLSNHWTAPIPEGIEWIVVDNNSTDSSVATANELGARVVPLDRNAGFSAANNIGLESANGRYIAFVNPDVFVQWDSLARLESLIDETGGLVAPQLLNPDGTKQPNGRGAPCLLSKVKNRTGKRKDPNYQVIAEDGEVKYVAWLIGAVVAGASDTVRRLGGWDESYFLYYEDKDISLRAWRSNVPVLLDGNVSWTHSWARATKSFSWAPWKREIASAFTFYKREPRLLLTSSPSKRNAIAFLNSGKNYRNEPIRASRVESK